MRPDVQDNILWSDAYMSEIRQILLQNAMHLVDVRIADFQQDTQQATDMTVTISGEKCIGVRLRRTGYAHRDLTIRAWLKSGAPTELHKLLNGYADYYLYGWTKGWQIPEWMLVNLDKLRNSGLLHNQAVIRNRDGRTGFIAINWQVLKRAGCLVDYHIR